MKRPLLAILLALSLGCAGAAHAQNILILTTGDGNTVVPPAPSSNSGDIENNYMDGVIREFGAPLTLATCSSTPQTVTDPNTGLSKTVTCNSSELVNRTAMSPSMFDPGYDLLVVVSAYSEIDALDWPVIEQAIQTRKVRSAILFIDTVTASNADRVKPLLDRALGLTGANVLGNGTSAGNSVNAHTRNSAAAGASDFTALPAITLSYSYYPYTNVPAANALYLGYNDAGPVSSGVTQAVGVLVPSSTSYGGTGACLFGANDIGWADMRPGNSGNGWAANNGKVGRSFLQSFNNQAGACAAAIAVPPVLDVAKATTALSTVLPTNGSTVPYTVTVSNTSAVLANNVGLSDAAPAGLSFGTWTCTVLNPGAAPATTCPSTLPSGNLNTSLNLSAGAQLQFSVNATVTDNQLPLTNTATLNLPVGATCAGGRSPCDASVAFSSAPAVLNIEKSTSAPTSPAPANGATLPYTVTVSNPSAGAATGVTVSDAAPAGMSFGAWTCTVLNAGNQASTCPATLPNGNLATTVDLSAGAQLQFSVTATVNDNTLGLTNVASLGLPTGSSCTGGRAPCDASVVIASQQPPQPPASIAPVPILGEAALAALGALLAALGLRSRARARTHA